MIAASCLTLAAVHLLVWLKDRSAKANGIFAITALSTAAVAWFELALMRADTPELYETLHRWGHLAAAVFIFGLIGFTWTFLQAGRRWLGWVIVGLRLVILSLNFSPWNASFNWKSIERLETIQFLGESVSMPVGIHSTWSSLGDVTIIMLLVFVIDATASVLRRESTRTERKRAVVVGLGMIACVVIAGGSSILMHSLSAPITYLISAGFMMVVLAMGYELSNDLVKASQLTRDLQESERRNDLAAKAANLGLWMWDVNKDVIWATNSARQLYGLTGSAPGSLERFLQVVHPDDVLSVRQAIERALSDGGDFEADYRIVTSAPQEKWVHAQGQVEFDGHGTPVLLRGVSIDVTEKRESRLQLGRLQQEIVHVSRVSLMGELSASLAHELNQPLTAIMANTQAAQRFIANNQVDLDEFREILKDIVSDTTRASDVIRNVHTLVKKGEREMSPLHLNEVVAQVVQFLHCDIVGRNITLNLDLAKNLPSITGDRTQIQQVLINLLLNAFDAVGANPVPQRQVSLVTVGENEAVYIRVQDTGLGIEPEHLESLFQPFFTTKVSGMGMGLTVSRSIVEAHGGRLWAENLPGSGARLSLTLPVASR